MEKWRIIVFILIIILLGFILLNIDTYCFTFENKYINKTIHECGKKAYLEEKYKQYLHPELINFSTMKYEIPTNFTYIAPN